MPFGPSWMGGGTRVHTSHSHSDSVSSENGNRGRSQEHVRVRHDACPGHVRSTYQHQTTWRLSGHRNLVNLIRWPMQWRFSVEPYGPCMYIHSCYLILFCLVWNSRIAISYSPATHDYWLLFSDPSLSDIGPPFGCLYTADNEDLILVILYII